MNSNECRKEKWKTFHLLRSKDTQHAAAWKHMQNMMLLEEKDAERLRAALDKHFGNGKYSQPEVQP